MADNEADVIAVVTARDEASDTLKGVSSSMGGLVTQFALGNVVANVAIDAWGKVKDTFSEAYQASNTIQNSIAQINTILKDNNDASGQSIKNITEWADKLNATTPISKEAALAGATTLLTFTDIGKNVFPQASQAAADLAEHMAGGGVVSTNEMTAAAKRLGVALTDPETGFSRLKLAGVTFTTQQEDAIKAMQATNGIGAAQSLMLQDLATKMGGAATTAGQTFTGQMTRLKDQLVDITEKNIIDKLKIGVQDLGNAFVKVLPDIEKIAGDINNLFSPAISRLSDVIKNDLIPVIDAHKEQLKDLGLIILALVAVPLATFMAAWYLVINVITAVIATFTWLINVITDVINSVRRVTDTVIQFGSTLVNSLVSSVEAVINWFGNLGNIITGSITGARKWLLQVGKDIIAGLLDGIDIAITGIGNALGKVGNDVGGAVKGALHTIHVPGFASGGVIPATPGGQLVIVGEGGQDEAIVPIPNNQSLPSFDNQGGQTNVELNITVQAGAFMGSQQDARKYAQQILNAMQDLATSNGMSFDQLWRHNGVRSI